MQGGRGSAKSFTAAVYALTLTYEPNQKILYTRYTLTSAEKSIIPEFKEKLELLGVESHFHITSDSIINKHTNAEILFLGIKTSSGNQTAKLKSLTGITTWIYDEFEEHPDFESFDKVDLSIRAKGVHNRVILVSNALHKQSWQYKHFFATPIDNCTYITTNYLDNIQNLSDDWIAKAEHCKATNIQKYNKDYLGLHYEQTDGALWKSDHIQYVNTYPDLKRIVVSIDPAITANKNSDETGIIVAGTDGEKAFVLDDLSGIYTPNQWAKIAIGAYNKYKADCIIAEVNQGGDLVKSNIHNIQSSIKVKQVRVNRGKMLRAEPVNALYEQGKVYHTKNFSILEYQMLTWDASNNSSPDRLDALVYAITDLLIKHKVQGISFF